jgi:hypothetical protein
MTNRQSMRRTVIYPRYFVLLAAVGVLQCRATAFDVLMPRVHSMADASVGGAPAGGSSSIPECVEGIATDQSCEYSSQCCSGLCSLDSRAELTCRPTPGCLGVGRACSLASECCSLACAAGDGGVGTCVESGLCAVIGSACSVNLDCCSNLCDTGQCADPGASPPGPRCATAGEVCSEAGECCGQVCNSDSDERAWCQLLAGCRVQGELCAAANDCCSGWCNTEKSGISRCAALGPCTVSDAKPCTAQVGDTCKNSDECCSHVCIGAVSDAVNRCAPAPGCRAVCDLCVHNSDCCSNTCVASADGVSRCSPAGNCLPEGETCTRDDQCCQTASKMRCAEEPKGLKGKRCVIDDPAVPCLTDGAGCALASRCCGGRCLPSANGGFVCASECVKENQPCTSRADCCDSRADCIAVDGQRVCREMIR